MALSPDGIALLTAMSNKKSLELKQLEWAELFDSRLRVKSKLDSLGIPCAPTLENDVERILRKHMASEGGIVELLGHVWDSAVRGFQVETRINKGRGIVTNIDAQPIQIARLYGRRLEDGLFWRGSMPAILEDVPLNREIPWEKMVNFSFLQDSQGLGLVNFF